MARPICFRLLVHWARRAASRADCTAGKRSAIRTAMMAMTTSSSIRVKAGRIDIELKRDLMELSLQKKRAFVSKSIKTTISGYPDHVHVFAQPRGKPPHFSLAGSNLFPLADFAAAGPERSLIGSRSFSPGLTVTFRSDVVSDAYFAGKGRLSMPFWGRPALTGCGSGSMRTLYSPSGAPSPAPHLIEKRPSDPTFPGNSIP